MSLLIKFQITNPVTEFSKSNIYQVSFSIAYVKRKYNEAKKNFKEKL